MVALGNGSKPLNHFRIAPAAWLMQALALMLLFCMFRSQDFGYWYEALHLDLSHNATAVLNDG